MGGTSALRRITAGPHDPGPAVTSTDPATALRAAQGPDRRRGHGDRAPGDLPERSTDFADIILPAATWGEEDFARNNAERRLRIYEKFMDARGSAAGLEDLRRVAKKMGFEGFDWEDSNEIFEEASARSTGGRRDFAALVEKARPTASGPRPASGVRHTGSSDAAQVGSRRACRNRPAPRRRPFKSDSGKANFVLSDWDAVAERNDILGPDDGAGEMWVLNGRVNALWNNLFDNARPTISTERWPANFLEIHADDAAERGIESGDLLSIESANVLDQLGEKHTAGSPPLPTSPTPSLRASPSPTSCSPVRRPTR